MFFRDSWKGTGRPLSVNLTSSMVNSGPVHVSVCVFSSLCQYYSQTEGRWRSDGLQPLEGSTLHEVHCLTKHLTMFGASLFIHPGAVVLLPPVCHSTILESIYIEPAMTEKGVISICSHFAPFVCHLQSSGPVRNVMVAIVCAVLVLIHLVVGIMAHKMDYLDSLRLRQVPLCGPPGLYQYRVLVKTGWRRGSGEQEPKKAKITLSEANIHMMGVNNTKGIISFRHHSPCWHQSVWCEEERVSPSAQGWSFPAWQPRPVSPGDR